MGMTTPFSSDMCPRCECEPCICAKYPQHNETPKYMMTNEELARAIDRAHESAGEASELQRIWLKHIQTLLDIQKSRAATTTN